MTTVVKPSRNRTNRAIPREHLRARIAAAALELFREHGFDAVSVDQIVARAQVSKGAFFVFFPTKADALIVYYDEVDARLEALRAAMDPARPLAALERFFEQAEALLRGEGPLLEALFRAIWTNTRLAAHDRDSGVRDRRGFFAFFDRAHALGAIDSAADPVVAADTLGDLWTGSVLNWLAQDRRYSLAEAVRPKLRLVFAGLAPKAAP